MSSRARAAVLLVDDDPAIRALARIYLERHGMAVVEAGSGEEALEVFSRDEGGELRLVITDLVMPGMSGQRLAEHLRNARPGFPVVFMTGYAQEAIAEPAGVRFLQKPFEFRRLVGLVIDLLESVSTPPIDKAPQSALMPT